MGWLNPLVDRDTILILPNTFFNDCFKDYKSAQIGQRLADMTQVTFIAEFVMLRKAIYPHLSVAATTKVAYYDEFKDKINTEGNIWKLSSSALEDTLTINMDKPTNDLGLEQSLIATANDMYTDNNLNPVIVVRPDSKQRWVNDYSNEFYKRHKDIQNRVEIYNIEETLIHLKSKYEILYQKTRENLLQEAALAPFIKMHIK